ELRVAATDIGGLFDEATLSVVVTNVDEKTTDVTLSKTSIAENRNAGATVGTLSIVDQDGPGASFALTSNPGGFFRVVGDKLQTARRLNFEKNKTHTITVEATDTGGATVSNRFTIKVADLVDLLTGNDRKNTLK